MQRNVAMGTTLVTGAAAVTMAVIGVLTWSSKPAPANAQAFRCGVSPFGIACGSTF